MGSRAILQQDTSGGRGAGLGTVASENVLAPADLMIGDCGRDFTSFLHSLGRRVPRMDPAGERQRAVGHLVPSKESAAVGRFLANTTRRVVRVLRGFFISGGSACGEALLVGEGGASLLTRQERVMAPF